MLGSEASVHSSLEMGGMLQKSALDIVGRFVCRSGNLEFFCLLAAVAWLSLVVVGGDAVASRNDEKYRSSQAEATVRISRQST